MFPTMFSAELGIAALMVLLQILDWVTTKIFISYNPLAESNPFFHKEFAEKGGPSKKFLLLKIAAGLWFAFIFLQTLQTNPGGQDAVLGIGLGLMSYVVATNGLRIIADKTLMRFGLYEPYSEEKLPTIAVNGAFHKLFHIILLLIPAIIIYQQTGNKALFWTLGGIFITILFNISIAYKYLKAKNSSAVLEPKKTI